MNSSESLDELFGDKNRDVLERIFIKVSTGDEYILTYIYNKTIEIITDVSSTNDIDKSIDLVTQHILDKKRKIDRMRFHEDIK